MRKSNSIFLAAIATNDLLADQFDMTKAKEQDPTKVRTLGVITKPYVFLEVPFSEVEYLNLITFFNDKRLLTCGLLAGKSSATAQHLRTISGSVEGESPA
ncbi:dynamin family protein [Colletotrichum limetticola]|uniref:Dynamin family protein n=1 Tax=Colletotrichum limetticola TaxID=1209924 RepID=A0ABQ9P5T5_9PEZI|nr:dynamin family protein [Colletotrichum limetticola]